MKSLLSHFPRPTSLIAVLVIGLLIGRCFSPVATNGQAQSPVAKESEPVEQIWTCSMHPSVHAKHPGKCPICGMTLIPLESGSAKADGPRTLRLEDGQKALAGIRTAPVVRKELAHTVRLVGKLAVDETALATLSAWVGGRLDRLFVDYTGLTVRADDHMAEIYSPQLFHAQEELIVAVESAKQTEAKQDPELAKIANATVMAARKKLSLYGLSDEQMQEIIDRGTPSDHITLTAPIGGTVIHRGAVEGQYVKEGDSLFTIADLKHLWLELDAYESDMPWIRYGQEVMFEVDAWPGEMFRGKITFIDPVLNPITRTVHLRVEVNNEDGRLRPEMYVRAKVQTMVVGLGTPAAIDMAGKWMCPMHPKIVTEEEGVCPICGMDLETVESLGYLAATAKEDLPLLIPVSAPLLTGNRALVFVELKDGELHGASVFEARDVVLGPRAGDYFVVREGLKEGEIVVSRGAFTIDSELQLRGKPSMMAPKGGGAGGGHAGMPGMKGMKGMDSMEGMEDMDSMEMPQPEEEQSSLKFRQANGRMLFAVATVGDLLADDDFAAAEKQVQRLLAELKSIDATSAPQNAANSLQALADAAQLCAQAKDLDSLRTAFAKLQAPSVDLAQSFGYVGVEKELAIFHCPMALGNGADWIDFHGDDTRNPYYGSSMLGCGDETQTISGFQQQ